MCCRSAMVVDDDERVLFGAFGGIHLVLLGLIGMDGS